MKSSPYSPILEVTRGDTAESIHFGAFAVVDVRGNTVATHGDPETSTYLRSTAKPFQVLPFLESGGAAAFNLSLPEIALACSSHRGTDEHLATVEAIQAKTGVAESDLLCGTHPPLDGPTAERMRRRGEAPTPNRHNCSGKHTHMLAYARMQGWPLDDYISPAHPVQDRILTTFAQMCDLPVDEVAVGIDGCSAPNFAIPLRNAALALARLCDPSRLEDSRRSACHAVTTAMMAHPEMVSGPGSFDTRLMEVAPGQVLAKGGAEGYFGLGIMPAGLSPGSPALGIAIKISDGDLRGRARPSVAIEILRQLGALSTEQLSALAAFGPVLPVFNWRKLVVGQTHPCFKI